MLEGAAVLRSVPENEFGIVLSDDEFALAMANMEQRATHGPSHPFFA